MEELRFPVGKFKFPTEYSEATISNDIHFINEVPAKLKQIISGLTASDFELPYRPDGWNVRQVIHHLSDSHMNAFIRFKLALTEENPAIKPYDEDAFVKLADSDFAHIPAALEILTGVHQKWSVLLRGMKISDFEKTYFHPESKREWKLKDVLALYVWHSKHHMAHIEQALRYKGNF